MTQTHQNDESRNQSLYTNEVLTQLTAKIESISTHNKIVETRISQVAQQQASSYITLGYFPKGHVDDVTTISGK